MKKAKFILVSVIAAMAFAATSCSSNAKSDAAAAAEEETVVVETPAVAGIVSVTDDNQFRPDTKVAKLTVIDFNATWCVPCKKLTPAFDRAAEAFAGKAEFYTVDIDNNPETAQAFGVQAIPTVYYLLPDGSVHNTVGLDEYVKGGNPESLDEAQLTDLIYGNMKAMIEADLQK